MMRQLKKRVTGWMQGGATDEGIEPRDGYVWKRLIDAELSGFIPGSAETLVHLKL